MMNNHSYNLMKQLVQEHKSLWRIKNNYKNDSADCAECQALWDKIEADKETHVTELTELLKKHLN